ncbi:winged helix-turn-helix domain-containing protein [Kitasatospora viridis]|nr:response regulator transcription factor [Kitasatospora viridis]
MDDVDSIVGFGPRAILLEVGLPDPEALAACRRIRQATDAALLVSTCRVDARFWLTGRHLGVDDFVVHPFGVDELAVRVHAALRPVPRQAPRRIVLGRIAIDLDGRTVSVGGSAVALTRTEFDILRMLADTPGAVVRRERICREVWQGARTEGNRSLEVHIANLRAKLGVRDAVRTVRGVGYLIEQPDAHAA